MAAGTEQRDDQRHRLWNRIPSRFVLELHLLPRRSGQRGAVRSSLRDGRERESAAAAALVRPRRAADLWPADSNRRYRGGWSVSHEGTSAALHNTRRPRASDERVRLLPERAGLDANDTDAA